MKKRVNDFPTIGEKRLLDTDDVCVYLSVGRNVARDFAKKIGAQVKIGRRVLYDKAIIDHYFDKQATKEIKEVV